MKLNMELVGEELLALQIHDIARDLKLALNSTTKYFVVNTIMSNLAEEVGGLDPKCTNPKSTTYFIMLPTIIIIHNPRRRNVDLIVDFLKSLMLNLEAYMSTM